MVATTPPISDRRLDALRGTPQRFAGILLALRRRLHAIRGDTMISAIAQQQQTQQARAEAAGELDTAFYEATQAREDLEGDIAAAFRAPTDPLERLAAATEEGQAWRRLARQLEAGVDLLALAGELGEAGDALSLRVLRGEAPSWLRAVHRGDRAMAEQELAGVLAAIDAAETPHLEGPQLRARQIAAELAAGWPRLEVGRAQAAAEIAGTQTTTVLPGWAREETVRVMEELRV